MLQSTLEPVESDRLPTDDELIRSTLSGNQQSFGVLVRRYQNRLFRSITIVVGSPTVAEDIVQDAFLKAFSKLHLFRGQSSFYTWLFRVALNARRQYFTAMSRASNTAIEEAYWIADDQDSGDMSVERMERCEQVRKAMQRINNKFRVILVLREFDGLDYNSIARVLNINVGTVRSRLSRARGELRKELQAFVCPEVRSPKTTTVAEPKGMKMRC